MKASLVVSLVFCMFSSRPTDALFIVQDGGDTPEFDEDMLADAQDCAALFGPYADPDDEFESPYEDPASWEIEYSDLIGPTGVDGEPIAAFASYGGMVDGKKVITLYNKTWASSQFANEHADSTEEMFNGDAPGAQALLCAFLVHEHWHSCTIMDDVSPAGTPENKEYITNCEHLAVYIQTAISMCQMAADLKQDIDNPATPPEEKEDKQDMLDALCADIAAAQDRWNNPQGEALLSYCVCGETLLGPPPTVVLITNTSICAQFVSTPHALGFDPEGPQPDCDGQEPVLPPGHEVIPSCEHCP